MSAEYEWLEHGYEKNHWLLVLSGVSGFRQRVSCEFGVQYAPNTKMWMAYRIERGTRQRHDLEQITSLKQAKNYCQVLQKVEADDGAQV